MTDQAIGGPRRLRQRTRDPVFDGYLVAAVLLGAYGATLVLRRHGQLWPILDNVGVDTLEVAVALACLSRALVRRPGRGPALALGLGLLGWALGDAAWTLESIGGASPPTPSVADGFYLMLYPLAYVAVLLLLRPDLGRVHRTALLDGAITGLGAAAICAAFAFDTILKATGGAAPAVAVNLAYPAGDLGLLALVVGAIVIVPGWSARLLLLAAGCALLAVGDTVYLFQSSAGTYHVGTLLDLTWPAGMLAMSAAVWLAPHQATRPKALATPHFVLPGLASAAGLVILVTGTFTHVSTVAAGLAAATLVAVGARMAVSIGEIARITEARRQQATTDELTGLDNRRQLTEALERDVPRSVEGTSDEQLALLLIDLDHFKEVNDSFGHPTGDQLLRQIGPRLRGAVRAGDLVARLGGDEFAVVLTGSDVDHATDIATRITASLEEPLEVAGTSLHVGASIGIAVSPLHASTAAELLRCADVAMYRAKGARSSFDTYEAALDDGADRIRLMEDLRRALGRGELVLHYQPQIDLHTGRVVTMEALVRWQHASLGLIPPDQFLPLAEEAGIIRQLTASVLDQAVSRCGIWWAEGHRCAVAVNLLATDLLDLSLPGHVTDLLDTHSLPPEALVLEITEQMVMADLSRAKHVIGRLSAAGLVVSVDDFGTGFSSLAYLSDLAIGELKLDRMFTARLGRGEDGRRDEAIVRSAIDLGHALNLRVVAEGIERLELIQLLAGFGCDLGQGFAIARPRPGDELRLAVELPSSVLPVADPGVRAG